MLHQRVTIPTTDGAEIFMDAYVPEVIDSIQPDIRRPAIVLFPGGGYFFCNPREGEPIALRFLAEGFNVFVVWYRVKPEKWPAQLMDAAAAIACVRARAEEWHTDPDRLAVMGFSAGGHLAAAIGTMWHQAELWEPLGLAPEQIRPNALVLSYAVITGEFGGCKTFQNTTGATDCEVHRPLWLLDKVTPNCPPAFLWHTYEDECVPVKNCLAMAQALADNGVLCELHLYARGPHATALCNEQTSGTVFPQYVLPHAQNWAEMAARFLRDVMK